MTKRHWCYDKCPPNKHKIHCDCYRNKGTYYAGCERLCVEKPEIKPGPGKIARGAMVCGLQSRQNYPVVADGLVEHHVDQVKHTDYKSWILPGIPFLGASANNVNVEFKGVFFSSGDGQLILDSNMDTYANNRKYIIALEGDDQIVYYTYEGNHQCTVGAIQDYNMLKRVTVLEKTH